MRVRLFILLQAVALSLTGLAQAESLIPKLAPDAIAKFQILAEEALVWRAKSLEFAEQNSKKLKKSNLTHAELEIIYTKGVEYLELRKQLLAVARIYAPFVDPSSEISFRPHSGTLEAVQEVQDANSQSDVHIGSHNVYKIRIDPTDSLGQQHILKLKLSLASALILYDNYMIGIYPYQSSNKVRYLLNRDVRGLRNELEKVTDSFFDLQQRLAMSKAIQLYGQIKKWENENINIINNDENYLSDLVDQSPFAKFLATDKGSLQTTSKIRAFLDRFYDRYNFLKRTSSFITSALFGNAVGLIAFREGQLKDLKTSEKQAVIAQMEPLDVMLEKTPFRLTDRFIPGYYGHVAIWVGNEAQLREIGIWEDPLVIPYHQAIQKGHSIIEALRPGVQINTLEHFLNIDDLLVLRNLQLNVEQKRAALLRAFAQIGKDYDFNFDVETDKRIVCSEIAYVVFDDIQWPTSRSLGRWTISPDNVAVLAVDGGPFEPILIYKNGQKVTSDLTTALQINLQGSRGSLGGK